MDGMKAIDIAKNLNTIAGKMYKDSDGFGHCNHFVEGKRANLARICVDAGFTGAPAKWEKDGKMIPVILPCNIAEARELAEELITAHNYGSYTPDFSDGDYSAEELERYQKLRDDYNGIDAHVYEAREEFAQNCKGDFAELNDVLCFWE